MLTVLGGLAEFVAKQARPKMLELILRRGRQEGPPGSTPETQNMALDLQKCELDFAVCRPNISDLSQAILESIWLIGFEGSSCDCPLVQTASLFDGLSFDDFPAF
jgi:hypothetical protein